MFNLTFSFFSYIFNIISQSRAMKRIQSMRKKVEKEIKEKNPLSSPPRLMILSQEFLKKRIYRNLTSGIKFNAFNETERFG